MQGSCVEREQSELEKLGKASTAGRTRSYKMKLGRQERDLT